MFKKACDDDDGMDDFALITLAGYDTLYW